MEIERETLIEVTVSAVAVGAFIAAVLVIGTLFSDNGLNDQGAMALIGAMVLFIVVMSAIGYWLSGMGG